MLEAELSARKYSKVEHNRALQARIGRSAGSIEFKHQNISAVLINFRQPFIPGYLPVRTTNNYSSESYWNGFRVIQISSGSSQMVRSLPRPSGRRLRRAADPLILSCPRPT